MRWMGGDILRQLECDDIWLIRKHMEMTLESAYEQSQVDHLFAWIYFTISS